MKIVAVAMVLGYCFLTEHAVAQVPGKEKGAKKKEPLVASYGEGEDFVIEPGMIDRIYSQSLTQEKAESPSEAYGIGASVRLDVFQTNAFVTRNSYFAVDYASGLPALYGVSVSMHHNVFKWDRVSAQLTESLGYCYAQGLVDARSASGVAVQDNIDVQFTSVSFGGALRYALPFVARFETELYAQGGGFWFQQSGALDGVNQTAWIPGWGFGSRLHYSMLNASELVVGIGRSLDRSQAHVVDLTQYEVGAAISL